MKALVRLPASRMSGAQQGHVKKIPYEKLGSMALTWGFEKVQAYRFFSCNLIVLQIH